MKTLLTACGSSSQTLLLADQTIETPANTEVTVPATEGADSYHWRQLSGISVEISDPEGRTLRFTAPSVTQEERLLFELNASFGDVTQTAEVMVIVHPLTGGDDNGTTDGNDDNSTDGGDTNTTTPDTTPPILTLNGESNITLTLGETYTELGATATDDRDGDITQKIIIHSNVDTTTTGSYSVQYDVNDTAGNKAITVTRVVKVVLPPDTTPPILTLNGESNITLIVGDTYTELGATAMDERDGDVPVSITGEVNSSQIGSYTLTYSATDRAGNEASVRRTVSVQERIYPPTITLTEPQARTLLNTTIPYDHITLEINATSTVILTALNQTLTDEQNRTIRVIGSKSGGSYYLYNVPLVKGANTIRLQATNRADEMVEKRITIHADANQSVPLAMRATVYVGVQSLDTTVEVGTDLNVTEYLFDVESDGKIDTIQNDANFTLHLTDEGRYRPRVTVRIAEGLLYSSGDYALSLDVRASAEQKDPTGAEPIDIAKAFVQALIEDDRDKIERFFLYSGSRWIRMLYEDDARRASMRERLRNINEADWSQVYHPSGAATVTTTVHDSSTNQDIPIGFELTPVSFDGIPRGRMWFVRAFY